MLTQLKPIGLRIQMLGTAAVAIFDVGTTQVHSRRTLVMVRRGSSWRVVHLHAAETRVC
jgi:hypothetical protein